MTAVRRLTTILLISLFAATLAAQEAPVARTTEPVTAPTDRDRDDPRALPLSLEEAIATAMKQNLGVQLQTYEYRIAGQNLRGQYGLFDWIASGEATRRSEESPTTSVFASSGLRATQLNGSVAQIIPTGGSYNLGWTNSRITTSGGGTFVNPAYRSGLAFSFVQPLMRDFGVDVTKRGVTIARNNLGIAQGEFRNAAMDTASAVEQAYLDLIYARRAVDVVKESLFLARDQARITQIRIDVGPSPPRAIRHPRVTKATTGENLIRAVASVRSAEDRLRALLNLPAEEWTRPIVPTDNVTYTPMTIDMAAAVEQALLNRPELTQQRLGTENLKVQALYTRNQVLPTVDFALGYNLNGLAGRTLNVDENGQPTGGFTSTGYTDSLTQLFDRDFPSWNVGVSVGIPIRNIGARANARAAQLDLEQSRSLQAQTEQNIAVEVRLAARTVDEYAQTIEATRAARDAAEKNLDAERKRYENGMTTNFQVLEVQQQLTDARVRELQAVVGYNKAVAAFHRAVGDILDTHNIRIEDPERVEEPETAKIFDRYNWLNYGSRLPAEEKPK